VSVVDFYQLVSFSGQTTFLFPMKLFLEQTVLLTLCYQAKR